MRKLYEFPSNILPELTRKDGADAAYSYLNGPIKGDPFASARGIVNGIITGLIFWGAIFVLVEWLRP